MLPVGAVEQHGPHMPICTDHATIDGMVAATVPKLPDDLPVLFLPTLAYGKSNEHSLYPGTITLSAATLMQMWMEIGASVARAGVRKFMLFNAHGGQMNAMDIVIRDLREQHGLMAVSAHWYTLGLPPGMFSDHELRHGIHAGDLETSVMLALKPRTVHMDKAKALPLADRDPGRREPLPVDHAQRQARLADAGPQPRRRLRRCHAGHRRKRPRRARPCQRPFHRAAVRGAPLRPRAAGQPPRLALTARRLHKSRDGAVAAMR